MLIKKSEAVSSCPRLSHPPPLLQLLLTVRRFQGDPRRGRENARAETQTLQERAGTGGSSPDTSGRRVYAVRFLSLHHILN